MPVLGQKTLCTCISAGGSVSSCRESFRLSSGVQEPEARGSELVPTFCTTKGKGTCVTVKWLGTQNRKGKESLSDCGVGIGCEAGHPGGLTVTTREALGWPDRKATLTYRIYCRNTAVFTFIEYLITSGFFCLRTQISN